MRAERTYLAALRLWRRVPEAAPIKASTEGDEGGRPAVGGGKLITDSPLEEGRAHCDVLVVEAWVEPREAWADDLACALRQESVRDSAVIDAIRPVGAECLEPDDHQVHASVGWRHRVAGVQQWQHSLGGAPCERPHPLWREERRGNAAAGGNMLERWHARSVGINAAHPPWRRDARRRREKREEDRDAEGRHRQPPIAIKP